MGVDPGSRKTGYGCIQMLGRELKLLGHGTLTLIREGTAEKTPVALRLAKLFRDLNALIDGFKPDVLVVEKVFVAKNALSALKLGQARGVILLSGADRGLEVKEYSPTEVKQSLVGYGRADKEQVAKMVQILLGKQSFMTDDASDALALAICETHHRLMDNRVFSELSRAERGNANTSEKELMWRNKSGRQTIADALRGPARKAVVDSVRSRFGNKDSEST